MRHFFLLFILFLSIPALKAQQSRAELVRSVVADIIKEYEANGFELVTQSECDKAPGELCRYPFRITPSIRQLHVLVIGSKKINPTLALEDSSTTRVITYTMEEDVSEERRVNIVKKTFNLNGTTLPVIFHFGNARSFVVEDSYLLIFKKEAETLGKQ